MLPTLLLLACAPTGDDAGQVRSASPSGGDPDARDTDTRHGGGTDPSVETVAVSHTRELRGLYVATVYNIDWPGAYGDGAATQEEEIRTLLDLAQTAGLNAVFVQVRPEGDALYASSIEPWSRWLTGTQGEDPGYDPLAVWVSEAHARGIEVHGWLNPYRAKVGSESTSGLVAGNMAIDFPAHAHAYGGDVWMDPGADAVRERVVDVVADIATRYEIDGIHFDDYFYPYPDDGDFPDDATWDAYVADGGDLARDDWRRANTARLVEDVAEALADGAPTVRFGIAPFGIWRPGYPAGISGFDAYAELYADPLHWAAEGWVDYLAPQLYWETTNDGQEYEPLAEWWNDQLDGTWLFPANALYQWGTSSTWTEDEYAAEIAISRDPALANTRGNLWYSASPFVDGTSGVLTAFSTRFYPDPALPPVVHALAGATEAVPTLTVDGAAVSWAASEGRRAVTVYAAQGEGWALHAVIPAEEGAVTLASGRWALASVGAGDVESLGVVVEIP